MFIYLHVIYICDVKMRLDEMEKELSEFLGRRAEDIKREIVDTAVVLKRTKGESVYVSVFRQGKYDIRRSVRDLYENYKDNERFLFKFFPIEPGDLDKYEALEVDEDGKLVDDEGDEYNPSKVLKDMKKLVLTGKYTGFNYQWEMFVRAFHEWVKESEGK